MADLQDVSAKLKTLPLIESPLSLTNPFLPEQYDLSLTIDHLKPNFVGKVAIALAENPASESGSSFSFSLHSHKLVVTKALLVVEEKLVPLQITNSRDSQQVTFSSSETTCSDLKGKKLTAEISFLGSVSSIKTYKDDTYGVFKTNYSDSLEGRSDNYIIATHTQPHGARSIFPIVDELTMKVPIKLTITTKSQFKVVSNAILESSTIVDMTENSIYKFKRTPPISPSVFGFVVGHLELIEDTTGKVPVRVYTTRGDSSSAQYALKVASKLLPQFENVLGVEYPLEKFDLVTLPFLSDWVMENWGMVTVMRENILLDEVTASVDSKRQARQLISHQLTHQWVGNLVTFDEWKYMWLIEAFATWIGDYLLFLVGIERSDTDNYALEKSSRIETLMDMDCFHAQPIPSLHNHMNQLDLSLKTRTMDIFEKDAYEKGMILLNQIGTVFQLENGGDSFSSFFKAFQGVLTKYQYKTIKPFEMWNSMNESISVYLLSFVHSWVRYPGFPLLKVVVENNKLKIVQNRYLYDGDVSQLGLENQPFHVPLAMKVLTDKQEVKVVNLMLSDRSMELDITPEQLVSLNAEKQFYYKVVYDPALQTQILKNISNNVLTPLDVIGLVNDYGKILGQEGQDSGPFGQNQILMLLGVCNALASPTWNVNYHVLKAALGYLEVINTVFVHFTEYLQFKSWLDSFSLKLFTKIGEWEKIGTETEYSVTEYEVRNVILQLAHESKESQAVCKRLYKNFVNSGVSQKFAAKELLSSMFNVTMALAVMAEFKQILSLVKNGNVSYLKHTNASAHELQTAAVSSLSFTTKSELLSKTLHFVGSNIDSKMIELALIGFKYQHNVHSKQALWAWYKVNYDLWINRSLRKGSDWSKQIGITVGNISRLVLGEIMQYKHSEAVELVKAKIASLPPHKLDETWELVEAENAERKTIAKYYDAVVDAFKHSEK